MPALVSFASVLRRSRYRLDISNPVSLLRRILCLRQPPKLIVKDHAKDLSYLKAPLPSTGSRVVMYIIPDFISPENNQRAARILAAQVIGRKSPYGVVSESANPVGTSPVMLIGSVVSVGNVDVVPLANVIVIAATAMVMAVSTAPGAVSTAADAGATAALRAFGVVAGVTTIVGALGVQLNAERLAPVGNVAGSPSPSSRLMFNVAVPSSRIVKLAAAFNGFIFSPSIRFTTEPEMSVTLKATGIGGANSAAMVCRSPRASLPWEMIRMPCASTTCWPSMMRL